MVDPEQAAAARGGPGQLVGPGGAVGQLPVQGHLLHRRGGRRPVGQQGVAQVQPARPDLEGDQHHPEAEAVEDLAGQRHHPDQLGRLLAVEAGPAGDHGRDRLLADPPPARPRPARPGRRRRWPGAGRPAGGPVEAGAEADQHAGGHALALADQPEQDVLGADVVVAELERLAQRQLQDLLGSGSEGDVPARRLAALADLRLDLGPDGVKGDAELGQGQVGDPFALVDQPEQDVLGADVVVVEEPGLLLGEHDHPPGPVRETLEHRHPPPVRATWKEYAPGLSACGRRGAPPPGRPGGRPGRGRPGPRRPRAWGTCSWG